MKKLYSKKGFTLVELLIVIALLGALAIGLIGALDPFEQLKKGTDTGTRNSVSEIHSAIIRYYALKGFMPWCTDALTCTNPTSGVPLLSAPMVSALSMITLTGELKTNFTAINSGELGKVFVTGTETDVIVCYKPGSKSFRSDINTKYLVDGQAGVNCGTTDATACYWCVR
jgi:prepilin-type N-terminal cleavage/methylation domain-containing protein